MLIHTHLLPTSLGELGINRAVAVETVGRRHAQIDQRPRRVDRSIGGFGGHAIREARRQARGPQGEENGGDTQKKWPVISKSWGIYTFNEENLNQ